MSRLTRLAILVALAAVLAWPHAAQAAPPDRTESGGTAAPAWLAQLWAPLARLLGSVGVGPDGLNEGPTMDPNGVTEAPGMDPNGATGSSGQEGEEGPGRDPNGATGSFAQDGDEAPGMDPNG